MNRRAFTLIEMLVVLAVFGVLAALLFPVVSRARESGRRSSCLSNQKQVVAAMQMYVQDFSRLPTESQKHSGFTFGWDLFKPYAKSAAIFNCPAPINEQPIYFPRSPTDPTLLTPSVLSESSLLPEPRTVVTFCQQHLGLPLGGGDNSSGWYIRGSWLVARWDGSASVVQGSQTRQWIFHNGKWQLALNLNALATTDDLIETRFPDEEWPPNYR